MFRYGSVNKTDGCNVSASWSDRITVDLRARYTAYDAYVPFMMSSEYGLRYDARY